MGKRRSWFAAIKRVFTPHSKKKGIGRLRHGESNSFLPIFREPSSIEKILGEAEREHQLVFRHPSPTDRPKTPPFVSPASPRASSQRAASPRAARVRSSRAASPPGRIPSPRAASPTARAHSSRPASPLPKAASSSPRTIRHYLPEPILPIHHASATKIQAAYRGYMARRSFRALKGLVRLQGVIKGQNVKRQTASAMKYMQLLVRVQSQIQSRRIQMLENQARQYQSEKEAESTFSKWTFGQPEAGHCDNWDDSLLTKEEVEARMRRKAEAAIKRERAMAYAHTHQLQKANPKSTQTMVSDIRSGGFPRWWSWLERQLPSESRGTKNNIQFTPPRPASERKASAKPPSSARQQYLGSDNIDASTPKSSRSSVFPSAKPGRTPLSSRTAQASTSSLSKYSRPRASGADSPFSLPAKDDDSLMSCPPFSAPNYMTPTVSARAKVRASSNPKERFPGTPGSESSKRRLSSPFSQGIGSLKWDSPRVSLSSSKKDPSSPKVLDRHQSLQSIGNLSFNSTVSMPATVGRRPFNRFV